MERQIRSLVAWMDREEAVTALLGHQPHPSENIGPQIEEWEEKRGARDNRSAYTQVTPVLSALPSELAEAGATFEQRDDVRATFSGLEWTVGMVDLRQVLTFQKAVVIDGVEERVGSLGQEDLEGLFNFCLPPPRPIEDLPAIIDKTGKGVTLNSLNPNLRIAGLSLQKANVSSGPGQPPQPMQLITFALNLGAPFVQIVEYNGRWFVRDGNHRAYGLVRRGINVIPAVFIRAKNSSELGAEQCGGFAYEILFGERPPFLSDFSDDSVSSLVKHRTVSKVVRVTAEEFAVGI